MSASASASSAAAVAAVSSAPQSALQASQTLRSTEPQLKATKQRIQDLVTAIAGPNERLEPELEALLLEVADDFVENAANFACLLAKHRQSNTLEVQDLQLHLEKTYHMRIPGFTLADPKDAVLGLGPAAPTSTVAASTGLNVKSVRPPTYGVGEAHRKRMQLIVEAKQRAANMGLAAATNAAGVANTASNAGAAATTGAAAGVATGAAGGATAMATEDGEAAKPAPAGTQAAKKRKRGGEE